MKGIDVSTFNNIGVLKKSASCEFAILRGGFTGWGSLKKEKDAKYEAFYKKAKEIGLPIGVYYYSCANTREAGISEAKFLYDNCLKGRQFEFPIFIDVENVQWQSKDKKGVTDAIVGFCEALEGLGYLPGVYSSKSWFADNIDSSRIRWAKWVAWWGSVKPVCDMWQNSDNAYVNGFRVDSDICYKDFPTIVKTEGLNGYKKKRKKGDVDGDGKVTSLDARLALRAAVGLEKLDKESKEAADMDGDGKITADDAREILRGAVHG